MDAQELALRFRDLIDWPVEDMTEWIGMKDDETDDPEWAGFEFFAHEGHWMITVERIPEIE